MATLQMTTKIQLFRLKMTVRRMEKVMRVKLIKRKLEFYVKETIPQKKTLNDNIVLLKAISLRIEFSGKG